MNDLVLSPIPLNELEILIQNSVRKVLSDENCRAKNETEEIGNIDLASRVTGLKKPTIYAKVASRTIPHSKRSGRLYFSRQELLKWIDEGKRKTVTEIRQAVDGLNSQNS